MTYFPKSTKNNKFKINEPFVQLENSLVPMLKYSSLHVYLHLKSKRRDWVFYVPLMAKEIGVCAKTVIRCTKKLIEQGLVSRERIKLSNGVFGGYRYTVRSLSQCKEFIKKLKVEARERAVKAKKVAKLRMEQFKRYCLKKPYAQCLFSIGTFYHPNNINTNFTKDCIYNASGTYIAKAPSNGFKYSEKEIKEQKQYILDNF